MAIRNMSPVFPSAKKSGYKSNKDVRFDHLDGIHIFRFRTLADREVHLGKYITLITGKNGTMKSSILGLIAHPFSSPTGAKDVFGKDLKTDMRDVFRMSLNKDVENYKYCLNATTTAKKSISELIRMYPRLDEGRHRITVSSDNKTGSGNFLLNTAYVNLKRLFPIVETSANVFSGSVFTEEEKKWISQAYIEIMTIDSFTEFDCISDYKDKNTLGPKNTSYDFNSISSGEDNLGNILMKLLAFSRANDHQNYLQGILCIDEIEASLHPVALINLFNFLLNWSKTNRVQIVATTHSLYLLNHALKLQLDNQRNKGNICINVISTVLVGDDCNYRILQNLAYKDMYKELTLKADAAEALYKVNLICEDDMAIKLLRKIIGNRNILKSIEFISDISYRDGSSYTGLLALAKNGARLLEDSVLIFDPDVGDNVLKNIDRFKCAVCIIPDVDQAQEVHDEKLPIETRIVKFITELNGDNPIFGGKEKRAYLNDFHAHSIIEGRIGIGSVKNCKTWKDKNKREFNKFLSLYIKTNRVIFDGFKNNIVRFINDKRIKNGLTLL